MTPEEQAQRELAKLDEEAAQGLKDVRMFSVKHILIGALCAVAASALIVLILEANKPRAKGPAAAKPVPVQIVPPDPGKP